MAHTSWTVPFNVPIESLNLGYLQVVIQFPIIDLQITLEYKIYLRHLNSLRLINGVVLHFTAFKRFHKICTMRTVLDKISFLTTFVISPLKFLLFVADLKRFGVWHGHAPVKIILASLTKYNQSFMLLPSVLKLRNFVARKGNEVLTFLQRAYPKLTGSPQSEEVSYTS